MDKLFSKAVMEPVTASGAPNTDANVLVQTMSDIRAEISRYQREKVDINANPLTWWSDNAVKLTHLSKHAQKCLTVCGTSVPSERIFSAAGNLVNAKRACLKSDNIDMLIFLNKNWSKLE